MTTGQGDGYGIQSIGGHHIMIIMCNQCYPKSLNSYVVHHCIFYHSSMLGDRAYMAIKLDAVVTL